MGKVLSIWGNIFQINIFKSRNMVTTAVVGFFLPNLPEIDIIIKFQNLIFLVMILSFIEKSD